MRTTYEIRGLQASKCGTGKIVEWSNGVKRGLSYFLKCFLEGVQIYDNVSNEYHCCDMFRAPVRQFNSIRFKKFLSFLTFEIILLVNKSYKKFETSLIILPSLFDKSIN